MKCCLTVWTQSQKRSKCARKFRYT